MGYLSRLIDKAVNNDQENNKIGKYKIEPQHGNVYVYNIYKEVYSPRFHDYFEHLATVTIDGGRIDVAVEKANSKEVKIIKETLEEIYDRKVKVYH
jgi:hypothetical protein